MPYFDMVKAEGTFSLGKKLSREYIEGMIPHGGLFVSPEGDVLFHYTKKGKVPSSVPGDVIYAMDAKSPELVIAGVSELHDKGYIAFEDPFYWAEKKLYIQLVILKKFA